tara:strand:- start:750 stop:1874 length:1125 start_codon:yes stop_codon:yes gene_type:complete
MRFFEFKQIIKEAEARIQHAEDFVIFNGSKGAAHAVESLKSLEQGGHKDVTIKWDGSPAIIFGRNEDGEFVFTDKSGFVKKGGVERATSGDDLEQFLLNRGGGANRDKPDRIAFASNMKEAFSVYEKAVPRDFKGYFKGDLLYYNTPPVEENKYVFTPNIVTYRVDVNSDLGKKISQSKTGVVIHRQMDGEGNETAIQVDPESFFAGNEVLVVPPVTVSKAPNVINDDIKGLQALVSKSSAGIDKLLDKNVLGELKLADFDQIMYLYMNQTNMQKDFFEWLKTSKVSVPKQQRLVDYIGQNKQGFEDLWKIVGATQAIKNDIIDQFDSHDADVKASIGNNAGGEGYVIANPKGDLKLVNRGEGGFTQANRAVQR